MNDGVRRRCQGHQGAQRHRVEAVLPQNRDLREAVLETIADYVESVYYVYGYRPDGYEFVLRPKQVHLRLLENLARDLDLERGEDVLIFVDSNDDLVSEHEVKNALNPSGAKGITCLVLPSRYFLELQGHDFVAGGVGYELNSDDTRYTDILRIHGSQIYGRKVDFKLRRRKDR